MTELKEKFKNLLQEITDNVKNKEDVEFVQKKFYELYVLFLDEYDKLIEQNSKRIDAIVGKYKAIESKLAILENTINVIEKDIYVGEESEDEFEIVCPYCNYEFFTDFSTGIRKEIQCPECQNTIELDWNDEENSCEHSCHDCEHDCNNITDEQEYNDDEDM